MVLYAVMAAAIAWQAVLVLSLLRRPPRIGPLRKIAVTVRGNVERPGMYRVPLGTTQFEILKVAGVRMTSDLSGLSLGNQVEANQDISVGKLKKEVGLAAHVRLEFFLGGLTIEAAEGKERPVQEGISAEMGDRVRTKEDGQAEFSINAYSRIDLDRNTEIAFDRIGVDDAGKPLVEVFQWAGLCWYKIVYAKKEEAIKVVTPAGQLTVGGKGADFTVEAGVASVVIENREGVLLVERLKTGEALNLIAGQAVTLQADGRPFEVATASIDATIAERFSTLNKAKAEEIVKYMPLNVLISSPLGVFHLISVQFDRNQVQSVYLPGQLYIADFAQGFATLREAYLYGGSAFATTLIERIFNTRISKYAVLEKDDVLRAVSTLGGVNVPVDEAAASVMRIKGGKRKLKDEDLVSFMRPGLSGEADAVRRQTEVIKAIFDGFSSNNIVLTALMADQIMSGIESNMGSAEVMKHYANFKSRPNWTFQSQKLPSKSVSLRGRTYMEPVLESCRKLLTEG